MGVKLLVLGIDSMDPRIVEKLGGKLPNLGKLHFSKLQTTIPPETPVAWSAAATGSNPGRYGIFDFLNRNLENYKPKLSLTNEKQGAVKTEHQSAMLGTPFWRTLTQKNVPVSVIRWPVTFPPEKINGNTLSGLGVVDIKGMLNSYSFYTDEEIKGEGKEKVIQATPEGERIETYVSGPFKKKGGEMVDVRKPMTIELRENSIDIYIDGQMHNLKAGEWSEMVRVRFKVFMFLEVYGIMNFYLESINPFRLYASSVQIDPENQHLSITYPKEYGKELTKSIGLFHTLGMAEETKAVTENRLSREAFLGQVKQVEEQRTKMFYHEFEKFKEGVLTFVFDAGDRLTHIFWENSDELKIPKAIEDYYVEKDKLVGDVLSKIDEETKLIILSDHGFNNFTREVNINTWLAREGYMKTDKSETENSFEGVKWGETKAYALGFTSLFLNLKGRESQGSVSKEEKDSLIDEIVNKLKDLEDNGKKVFTQVYKGSDIYRGEQSDKAPDVVLGFSPGYRSSWKNAVGALDREVVFDNKGKWQGDHLIDRSHVPGVLFTNFKIGKEKPEIVDIAPTIFRLLNIEIPERVDGEALI